MSAQRASKGEEKELYTSSQLVQIGYLLGRFMSSRHTGIKMLAAYMVGGEPFAPLSTLLVAEPHLSPRMLVWDQQQAQKLLP